MTDEPLTPEQAAFLRTFLGVDTGPGNGAGGASGVAIWRDARDRINDELNQLQRAMLDTGVPLLVGIAETGLNSVTEGRMTRLQAALMDADRAAGDAQVRARARAAVADMRGFVDSTPVLALLEDNPLGVTLTLRNTLQQALARLDALFSR